jgi:hypothetical protein
MERVAALYAQAANHRAQATFDDRLWYELAKETSDDVKTVWGAYNVCRFVDRESSPAARVFLVRQVKPFYHRLRCAGRLLHLWIFDARLSLLLCLIERRLQRTLDQARSIAPDLADVWLSLRSRSIVREEELRSLAASLDKRKAGLAAHYAPMTASRPSSNEVRSL